MNFVRSISVIYWLYKLPFMSADYVTFCMYMLSTIKSG